MVILKRQPCIYRITNIVNKKIYVGQTNRNFKERKKNHISKLRRNVHDNAHLQGAWNKYGEENFIFSVLVYCKTEHLDSFECEFIKIFDTLNRRKGYNLESGGSLTKKLSVETRKKLGKAVILTNTGEKFPSASVAAKKYNLSQGTISSCCRGELKSAGKLPNGEYSVWVLEENFIAGKDYSFHRHLGKHNPRAKKVICLTTNKTFETMKSAGEYYGIKSHLKISEVCRGKRKHCGQLKDGTKLSWAYID